MVTETMESRNSKVSPSGPSFGFKRMFPSILIFSHLLTHNVKRIRNSKTSESHLSTSALFSDFFRDL